MIPTFTCYEEEREGFCLLPIIDRDFSSIPVYYSGDKSV